jgi:hypothetical protein
MSEKRWLTLILLLYFLLGVLYALKTPIFEASDELWHYPMIRHLADGNPLPVQVFDPALAGPWKQEASQPPLYYYLGAALTFWIDTADMETVRWENPHVDNGVITADGNRNLVVHDPAQSPWQGTLLAVRIVRLFSVLLGGVTVFLTYLIAKEAVPDRAEIALGAAVLNAFLPMFLFISGAVNNDNLAIPLASWALLLMIRMVTRNRVAAARHWLRDGRWLAHWLLLGVVIGLATLTKEGTFGLLPLAVGTAVVVMWQGGGDDGRFWRRLGGAVGKGLVLFGLMLLPALLIAGWWYWRNVVLYGDWLGWSAFIAVLGQRAHPASLAQLWSERRGFLMSFWGLFGGVNVPMPEWIYTVLNGLLLVGVVGFGLCGVREINGWRKTVSWRWSLPVLVANVFHLVGRYFGLVVCLLFTAAVVVGLIQWATTTWSSQGRLVFTALSALCVLLVTGLVGWLPVRPSRWVVGALAGFLLAVAAAAPFLWIAPVYEPPTDVAVEGLVVREVVWGDDLRLVGYVVADTAVQPGDELWVTLVWDVLQPMERNWSIFVHLNDPVLERPIAQRDMYHGQGMRPTSLLAAGERVVTRHLLTVPETAVAPAELELTVGLYDFANGERLPVTESGGLPMVENAVQMTPVSLTAVAGEMPNPLAVQFEQGFELVGYALEPRRTVAGESVDLTLYWRLNQPVETDYTIFAQVVDETTTRWAALDLPTPTSQWAPGTVQPVTLSLLVGADTPPDVYPLIVGLYTVTADGGFDRLQRITDDGRPTDDFLPLTLLRVD